MFTVFENATNMDVKCMKLEMFDWMQENFAGICYRMLVIYT